MPRLHLCASAWSESTAGKSSAMLYFAGSSLVIKTTVHEESRFLRCVRMRGKGIGDSV
jgi:hypothetical protein